MYYFLATAILLNIMPGPAMFYVANQTLSRNYRGIVMSILGIEFGTILHIVASVFGLTLLIAEFPMFLILARYCSGGFLVYLGFSYLFKNTQFTRTETRHHQDNGLTTFFKGTIINVLNPKIILFFMAILPQFLNTSSDHLNIQILFMGLFFGLVGFVINILLSILINTYLKQVQQQKQSLYTSTATKLIGSLFVIFGVAMIVINVLQL